MTPRNTPSANVRSPKRSAGARMSLLTAITVAALTVPGAALAGSDDPAENNSTGACSAQSQWKLEVKERDGGLEVEFEVEDHRAGSVWAYTLYNGGTRVASGSATSTGTSGSFSVEKSIPGASLASDIAARANNAATGESCATTTAPSSPKTGSGSDDDGSSDDNSSAVGSNKAKRASGKCSAGSRWKLKSKVRDGRLEVEYEVDSNRSGQRWNYKVKKGKRTVASGRARTSGSSGSFSVEKKVRKSGTKRIKAVAKRVGGAERCTGTLKL